MLITAIAYHPNLELAVAYNEIMDRMRDDDWVCFIDHDAVWTTYDWYPQIQAIIEGNPDGGLFVAMTNRIGVPHQIPFPVRSDQKLKGYGKVVYTVDGNSHDMRFHRNLGEFLTQKNHLAVQDITGKISNGVVMVTSKSMWKEVGGFNEKRKGLGGCDTDYHRAVRKAGMKVYLMAGVYVYHWYREVLTKA